MVPHGVHVVFASVEGQSAIRMKIEIKGDGQENRKEQGDALSWFTTGSHDQQAWIALATVVDHSN
jgi:hypothetical protein